MDGTTQTILDALSVGRFATAVFIILLAAAVARLFGEVGRRLAKEFPHIRLRIEQWVTILKFLALVTGVLVGGLALFGFSKEMILAVGASGAVAIGFGLKDIAASVLAGFIVLFERPFQVGDRVTFGDTYGDVIALGLRSVRIRTLDDSIVSVPNSKIMTEAISSANAGALDMLAEVDIHVAPQADLDLVETLAREAAVSSRYVYLKKPVRVLFFDVFVEQYFCTRVRIQAYVIETKYEKPFESDLTRRLHAAFAQHSIGRPTRMSATDSDRDAPLHAAHA